MDRKQLERMLAGSGIVFVILLIVGAFLPGSPPNADATPEKFRAYMLDHRSALLAGMFLIAVGVFFFLMWLTRLRTVLRAAEDDDAHELSTMAYGAGLVTAAVAFMAAAFFAGFVYKAAALAKGSDALIRTVVEGQAVMFAFLGLPVAVLVAATSMLMVTKGVIARWLGWWGAVVAVLNIAGATTLFFDHGFWSVTGSFTFVPFLAQMSWILLGSVAMVQHAADATVTRPVPRTV